MDMRERIEQLVKERQEQLKTQKSSGSKDEKAALEALSSYREPIFWPKREEGETYNFVLELDELELTKDRDNLPCFFVKFSVVESDDPMLPPQSIIKDKLSFMGMMAKPKLAKQLVLAACGIDPSIPDLDNVYDTLSVDGTFVKSLCGNRLRAVSETKKSSKGALFAKVTYLPI